MGDLLKAKIQQRPDREELVRQHILEADVGHVDPSLAERQRMLKKARLADSLNDQLSHRPGPLELIKKNILHTEEPIERAVKEGVIPFKATSEGQLRKPQHPDHYISFEDDSQSSEGGGSPPSGTSTLSGSTSLPALDNIATGVIAVPPNKTKDTRPRDVLETAAASAGIVNVAVTIPTNAVVVTSPILQQLPSEKGQTLQTFAELCSSVVSPLSLGSSTSSLSPLSSIASPPTPVTPRPAQMSSPAPGKADKNRKKSKTKTQPKARTIKFHEYKGPPNAQKNMSMNASSTETSYELLLQQQQLFLQWQVELQHKYPQIILPAAQKPTVENITTLQNTISSITNAAGGPAGTTFLVTQSPRCPTPVIQPATPQSRPPSSPPQSDSQVLNQGGSFSGTGAGVPTVTAGSIVSPVSALRILTKLEDMKVSDLKIELKKRNLPVSGPKPQLIERLKPFTQTGSSETIGQQSEASVSGGRTTSTSSGENPGSVLSDMDVVLSPSRQEEEEPQHLSPGGKTCTPTPSSPAPTAMDTSEPTPPTSPNNGDIIIQQQQRKIEELQRELQKSQQQLQQIREGKESNSTSKIPSTAGGTTGSTPSTISSSIPVKALLQNGVIHIDSKSQQKLILQQHLQNKIQQQQLQIQLQQQQQQSGQQQFSETVNAKANLAAFINQQQAQQHLNNLLQAANTAIVLNHLNLVKQKNGILGHQRTSSLPTFLGALVQNVITVDEKHSNQIGKLPLLKTKNIQQRRAGSEEQQHPQQAFVVSTKPPPEYEDATKALKQDLDETSKRSKNVKSQIVDDVLEILIKNGELPPSAANDPATPTTPDRSGTSYDPEGGLMYPPAPPPPPPPPPLPQPGFSVTLPTSISLTSQSQPPAQFNLPNTTFTSSSPFTLPTTSVNPSTFTLTSGDTGVSSGTDRGAGDPSPIPSNLTFSVGNASFLNTENPSKNTFTSGLSYLENTDFDLSGSSDQNFHSNTLDYILSSNDNLLSSAGDSMLPTVYGNGDINLKELGLDLETLDSVDFCNLDCKMEGNDTEMDTTPRPQTPGRLTKGDSSPLSKTSGTNKTDQLINNNPDLVKAELMEPMEMDDNWLDSLMPMSEGQPENQFGCSSGSSGPGYEFMHCSDGTYDSLLGSSQDPFELFDMHEGDFKLSSTSLSWDKVDFAT
ncbi:hypothetical protein RUM44_003114 [Polyplax serrata]|uniref:SAP domain-containing protein n=1 Tax=Polyplax serrata TaxID=468196 RepID=A0ABR1AXQ1_POLSC